MRKKITATIWMYLVFLVCAHLPLTPFGVKAQSLSALQCKWDVELVQEEVYNYDLKRTELRYRWKNVERCVPIVIETNSDSAVASRAKIQKIWVDYDVSEGQQEGMRIHSTFSVRNLKGKQCSTNAYFYYASGKPLKDFNEKFNTSNGKVAVHADFSPTYVRSTYKDFPLFMPYDELHLSKGKSRLKFVVELRCEEVGFLVGSEAYEFDFSRPE